MTARRDRRAPLAVVVSGAAAVVLGSMAPAGALEGLEAVITTTTSVVVDATETVAELTGETTTSTTSSSTTTTSTTSSTSTTTSTTSTTSTTAVPRSSAATSTTTVVPPSPTTTPAAVTDAAPAVAEPSAVPVTVTELTAMPPGLQGELPAALATPTGPRSTLDVLALLTPRGATPQLVARILSPFPVVGAAHYSDDWGAPRHGPPAHLHEGTDIFAERGTPVIASADGVVSRMTTTAALGGTSLRLTTANGTYFYYAHLDRFVDGLANGDRVDGGDVIGFVGQTGNAAGTPPHLHYEIHPHGGEATSPIPFLDRWLAEARTTARSIILSPAVDAVVSLQPSAPPRVTPPRAARRGVEQLQMRSLDTEPVSATVNPEPLLAFLVPIAGVSWLAARGRKHARRRLRSSSR